MGLIIASYPRSGNHLYRFILEFATGFHTQGCVPNRNDVPIFRNTFEKIPAALNHVTPFNRIGIKAHDMRTLTLAMESQFKTEGVHLIIRNPLHCLASHLRDSLSKKNNIMSSAKYKVRLKAQIKKEFRKWRELNRYYFMHGIYLEQSCFISYEMLIAKTSRVWQISKALETIKEAVILEKFAQLIDKSNILFEASASGKGRDWGGSLSAKVLSDYHTINGSPYKIKRLRKIIEGLLHEELEYCKNNSRKNPSLILYHKVIEEYVQSNKQT